MATDLDILSVTYDGVEVGIVTVSARTPLKIIGRFQPGAGFGVCKDAFTEAAKWASRFDVSHGGECLDYLAFNNYVAAIGRITQRIALPEINEVVEEFAVDNLSRVEITLSGVVF